MDKLLFLCHRIPFPPNKGDKIRSYHVLRHLAERHDLFVGTFVDDPADWAHAPKLEAMAAGTCIRNLHRTAAKVRSLKGLLTNEALTVTYYRDAALSAWTRNVVREHGIRKVVVASSAMAQFVPDEPGLTRVIDFMDVDPDKWTQYSSTRRWPMSWVFRREGQKLLAYERMHAARAHASLFCTPAEARLFCRLAPESADRVHAVLTCVDTDYYAPSPDRPSPYPAGEEAVVFTGVMDYFPNVDAAVWFAREVLPAVVAKRPAARFYIVGMKPVPEVLALARDPRSVVTGAVDDVRPYLQHAAVVVAPLRVARGVQNKILHSMAMGTAVVTSTGCLQSLSAISGQEIEAAETADQFAAVVVDLLGSDRRLALGRAARARMLADYRWEHSLARFDSFLGMPMEPEAGAALGRGAGPAPRANIAAV
jgi:sugar transferase (PEP-CTERM/EpsH1 system associated)